MKISLFKIVVMNKKYNKIHKKINKYLKMIKRKEYGNQWKIEKINIKDLLIMLNN